MSWPLAYFITFSTYGTWLHGTNRGSVDRFHNVPGTPYLSTNPAIEQKRRDHMKQEPYTLDAARRDVVLDALRQVCAHRSWLLYSAHIRSTHVHLVLAAPLEPEKVMSDLKAWASRRLREQFGEAPNRDRWTQHGSTRYLNDSDSLAAAVTYVLYEQGEPMSVFDFRNPKQT